MIDIIDGPFEPITEYNGKTISRQIPVRLPPDRMLEDYPDQKSLIERFKREYFNHHWINIKSGHRQRVKKNRSWRKKRHLKDLYELIVIFKYETYKQTVYFLTYGKVNES